jgi:hypothetical protein
MAGYQANSPGSMGLAAYEKTAGFFILAAQAVCLFTLRKPRANLHYRCDEMKIRKGGEA